MLMTFSFRENIDSFEPTNSLEIDSAAKVQSKPKDDKIHIFAEKLRVPQFEDYIPRPRLDELLTKSLNQIGAMLVTGRAGTGKTALAARFSRNYDETFWLNVESADSDWNIFSSYLAAAVKVRTSADKQDAAVFVENLFSEMETVKRKNPRLIVLDDVHNVFDAEWFNEFFQTALFSLSPETHLIFLSRSKPPFPLWRLRSKQVLTVTDEKVLAFDRSEAEAFCKNFNLSNQKITKIYKESYGRIGKLRALAESA
jgi:LuxR family maltose regulon positive regulatory protein